MTAILYVVTFYIIRTKVDEIEAKVNVVVTQFNIIRAKGNDGATIINASVTKAEVALKES